MCSLFHLYRRRGWELYYEDKFEEAIAEWRVAADLDPENGYILTGIGQALSELGRQEEAFSEWWKAIHLEPEYDVPYIHLADALFGSGDTFKALTTIRAALRLCPASANLHIRLGHYLAKQAEEKSDIGGWKAAGKAFRQALDIEPANSCALRYLARVQWLTGQKREAVAVMEAAVGIALDSFDAYMQLATYQLYTESPKKAVQTYRIALGLFETEEGQKFLIGSEKSMKRIEISLYVIAGLIAVSTGGWIWYRRRS